MACNIMYDRVTFGPSDEVLAAATRCRQLRQFSQPRCYMTCSTYCHSVLGQLLYEKRQMRKLRASHHAKEAKEEVVVAAAVATPGPPGAAAVVAGVEMAAAAEAVAVGVKVAAERRHFHLVNEANGSVLTVHRGDPKPGVQLHVDKPRPDRADHQIWYLDVEGIVRCKLNDFAICGKESGEQVKLVPYSGDAREQWILQGNKVVNRVFCNECLGLKKHLRLKDDADVIASPYEGKPFQHWRMEPLAL